MNWLKRKLRHWIFDDGPETSITKASQARLMSDSESPTPGDEPILNFKIYSAVGGKIVEFRRYDRQRDRHDHQTYIITADQDFGDRIAKIATMESLKS